MKKNITSAFVAVSVVLAVPTASYAQVVATAVSAPLGTSCYYFQTNLGLGSAISSSDAAALQQELVAQGLWNSSVAITSYNREVENAVAAFQEKFAPQILAPNGLTQPTGYFGVSTRSVLNQLYGCSTGQTMMPFVSASSFICPAGWTCTPPVTTVNTPVLCPVGWTCVQTSSVNVGATPVSTSSTSFYIGSTQPNLSVSPNSFYSLANQPSLSVQNLTPGGATTTTLKYTATFNVNIHAVTQNLAIGLSNSTYPAFRSDSSSLGIYKNGMLDSATNYGVVVSYGQPSNTTLTPDGQSFIVTQNQTVTVPVTYTFIITGTTANTYAVQLQGIYSSTLGLINSMMNQTAWRTASE